MNPIRYRRTRQSTCYLFPQHFHNSECHVRRSNIWFQGTGQFHSNHFGEEHVNWLASITASASMPPTPQPSTPNPFIMCVTISADQRIRQPDPIFFTCEDAIETKFTWWTIPLGGTVRKLEKDDCPHFRNEYSPCSYDIQTQG